MPRISNFYNEVEQAVAKERQRQDLKWGEAHDEEHSLADWIHIMRREVYEALYAETTDTSLTEVIHVAAVAMACLEHFGIPKENNCD